MTDLEARMDRLESYAAIQQLVANYAITLDGRDAKGWVSLYVPDVQVGRPIYGSGREDLERWFRAKCSYWYRSMHVIGVHQIHFDDDDHAHGLVQARVEQEIGEQWVTTGLLYEDTYRRVDGQWLFVKRHGMPMWCYNQHQDPPKDGFEFLPTGMPIRLPHEYPAFASFWEDFPEEHVASITKKPVSSEPVSS
jgi:ketosteroid isomerase-like protein